MPWFSLEMCFARIISHERTLFDILKEISFFCILPHQLHRVLVFTIWLLIWIHKNLKCSLHMLIAQLESLMWVKDFQVNFRILNGKGNPEQNSTWYEAKNISLLNCNLSKSSRKVIEYGARKWNTWTNLEREWWIINKETQRKGRSIFWVLLAAKLDISGNQNDKKNQGLEFSNLHTNIKASDKKMIGTLSSIPVRVLAN